MAVGNVVESNLVVLHSGNSAVAALVLAEERLLYHSAEAAVAKSAKKRDKHIIACNRRKVFLFQK